MFDRNYKKAMDKVVISEDSLTHAIKNATAKPKPTNALKLALIACLATVIICTSVFATLMISQQGNAPEIPENFDEFQNSVVDDFNDDVTNDSTESDHSSDDSSDNISNDITSDDISDDQSSDVNGDVTDGATDDPTDEPAEEPSIDEPDIEVSPEEPSMDEPDIDDITDIPPSLSEHGFKYAENYAEIYEHLQNIFPPDDTDVPSEPEDDSNDDYTSTTNTIHVTDVRDGDVIKTNGESIFILRPNDHKISIISVSNGIMEPVSEINVEGSVNLRSMLLIDNTLAVIGTSKKETVCFYYDVSNRNNPINTDSTSQSGYFNSCTAIDGKVYLITNATNKSDKKIPFINKIGMDYRNVIIMNENQNSFIVITAYDTHERKITSDLAILGVDSQVYCGAFDLYIAYTVENSNEPAPNLESATASRSTKLLKISLKGKRLKATAAGSVEGIIFDKFSLNESGEGESIFRMVTTIEYSFIKETSNGSQKIVNKTVKRVNCLDENMDIIGISEDFATNKYVLDIGFVDNIAYLYTYKTTEPLYAVDLSNPYAPTMIPELEAFGQWTYFKIYGNSHLLGINDDMNSHTGKISGFEFSLYDVSNQNYSDGIFNWSHKWEPGEYVDENARYFDEGLMIDDANGKIGIPFFTLVYNTDEDVMVRTIEYKLFSFENGSITEIGSFCFTVNKSPYGIRTVCIEDYLYFVIDDSVVAVSTTDFSVISNIAF